MYIVCTSTRNLLPRIHSKILDAPVNKFALPYLHGKKIGNSCFIYIDVKYEFISWDVLNHVPTEFMGCASKML